MAKALDLLGHKNGETLVVCVRSLSWSLFINSDFRGCHEPG
jgi:hypothetical protein